MTLANLHICTSLTEPSLSHTVISTKTKYAGLFDLFFTPNQAKLDMSLCASVFKCALWSPAGKGLTSWLSFVVSTVSLSLSHWYPGSGVVLDCIDSCSLHPYLLCFRYK